jgi:hypothetical protein
MKQQSLKYLLIGLVALIWGLIIYRVIKGLGGDDDKITILPPKKKIDYTSPADSFVLLADYPDPFLPTEDVIDSVDTPNEKVSNASFTNIVPTPVIQPQPPAFDPSTIQYSGIIVNPEKKIKIAILTIVGREYLATEKEKINEYLVKKIEKDRLIIIYKKETYTIPKMNTRQQ